jgi:hypothetical protein
MSSLIPTSHAALYPSPVCHLVHVIVSLLRSSVTDTHSYVPMWLLAEYITDDICDVLLHVTLADRRKFVRRINGPANFVLIVNDVTKAMKELLERKTPHMASEKTLVRQSPVS